MKTEKEIREKLEDLEERLEQLEDWLKQFVLMNGGKVINIIRKSSV